MRDDERTAVYRYFDAHGRLLYVGISRDPEARWKAHRWGPDREQWVAQVASRAVEWRASRPEALVAEVAAIKLERPRYNGTHNQPEVVFAPTEGQSRSGRTKATLVTDYIRDEIESGRWPASHRIPSLSALSSAFAVSVRTVSQAVGLLQEEGHLVLRSGVGLFVTADRVGGACAHGAR